MKQTIFQSVWILGITISLLVGCVAPVNSTLPVSPTITYTEFSPSATSTSRPTTTPRPTPRDTAIPKPNSIAAMPSEFNIPKSCLPAHVVSIDLDWFAGDCPLYDELIISNKTSGKQIKIRYKEIDPNFSDDFSTYPLSWASDNRYLYITTRCCDPDDRDSSNGALYRFDIGTETWGILIRAVYQPFYFFSPDGEKYVYLNHYFVDSTIYPDHLEIGMVDVRLNKNKRVVLRNYMGPIEGRSQIKWSKSENQFAIVLNYVNYESDNVWLSGRILFVDFNLWEMLLLDDVDFTALFVTGE